VTKGRRAADRRREREQGRADGGIEIDPSEATQFGPGEPTAYQSPERRDSLTRATDDLDRGTDDDGELEGEITIVREDKPKPRPPGLRIKLLADGVVHEMTTTPFFIGRGTGNDLDLKDMSVSRRHAQFVKLDDGGFLVEDLGSRSGTSVNGEVLQGAAIVTHGDLLQMGAVEMRLRFSDQVPEARVVDEKEATAVSKTTLASRTQTKARALDGATPEGKSAAKNRTLLFAALAAVLLVVVGVGVGVGVGVAGGQNASHLTAEIEALYNEAEKLFKAARFTDARARIDAILAMDAKHAGALSLLRMIESEEEAKAALDAAKAACDRGDVDACLEALDRIPDASMFKDARDKERARATALQRKVFFDEIEALIASGQYDLALARIDTLLERWPDEQKLKDLRARALAARGKKPPIPEGIRRARAAFAVGNREQARIIADADAARGSAPASAYVRDLAAFESAYETGQRALAAKKGTPAVESLERALSLSRSLSGGESGVTRREVGAALADALFLVGVADENAGRKCAGAEKLLRAYTLDPEDSKIAEKKRALDKRASDGLERARARAATKPGDAREIAREHQCFAARGSDVARELAELVK
jgi:pSer/pThr/pTyr-binding forkhead associated (FHA) protein/tetratricopeptide (TPR) repeat protein